MNNYHISGNLRIVSAYIVGIFLPLVLTKSLTVMVIHNPLGLAWELGILEQIHHNYQPELDYLAANLTKLGSYEMLIVLSIILTLKLFGQRLWIEGIYLLVTVLGATGISYISKLAFHRDRPHFWESSYYLLPGDYAFPSGHGMISMAFFSAILVLVWQRNLRWLVLIAGSIFVIVIGWTRLYLGVHFPNDILGGWLIALAWAVSMSILLKVPKLFSRLGKFVIIEGDGEIW